MSKRDDEELSRLVAELVTALRDLESELDPPRRPRPPTPGELRQFTSEVAIPGVILVLETNIRALRLLQRALELSERADRPREGDLGERARSVSDTTIAGLDDALAELERVIQGQPGNDEAAELLDDARRLRDEVQTRLGAYGTESDQPGEGNASDGAGVGDDEGEAGDERGGGDGETNGESNAPAVDVDAELESIKAEVDDLENSEAEDGSDAAGETDDGTADESADEDGESPEGSGR